MRALVCALVLMSSAALFAEPTVRVRILSSRAPGQCVISSQAPMNLADESGRVRAVVAPGHEVMLFAGGDSVIAQRGARRFTARAIRAWAENGLLSVMGRAYRGEISARSINSEIVLINTLPLEDYLRGVVPCEMPVTFHPEALKAQAVVARTIALRWLGKHSAQGADFCDLTHCQVYQGASAESPRVDAALAQTRGLVLTHQGELASTVYHSTCGGHTADANLVWPGRERTPYLKGQPDALDGEPACAKSPHFRWTASISSGELDSVAGFRDAQVRVLETDPSGRAALVQLTWPGGRSEMTGEQFYLLVGRKLGWNRLKSARFTVRSVHGGWLFEGRGLGHGVGMCQWGANGRANSGRTMPEILSHYFPGTKLTMHVGGPGLGLAEN